MNDYQQFRQFMKSSFGDPLQQHSDQTRGLPNPALQKEIPEGAELIDLPEPNPDLIQKPDLFQLLEDRESRRNFTPEPLSLEELGFLLYCTQGLREEFSQGYASRRTVPSAGARHPFETYLAVIRVEPLAPGIYRYLPFGHQLLVQEASNQLPDVLTAVSLGQRFVGESAVVFLWSCIPYRAEWRYMDRAHKSMLLDAGHICQNLYLGAEALGLGTCAIGAYDQASADALLELDGQDEYVVYLAPVGKI